MKHPQPIALHHAGLAWALMATALMAAPATETAPAPSTNAASAQPPTPVAIPRTPTTASTIPELSEMPKHGLTREKQIAEATKGHNPQVILIGDSITEFYNKEVWDKNYGPYDGCRYGFSGENTENILAHIANGVLDGINPKVAILLIGTNNLGHNKDEKPEWVAAGIKAIVESIHQKLPKTQVLVMGIFPRGRVAADPLRARVAKVNAILSQLDDGKTTRFIDISAKFIAPNGDLDPVLMGRKGGWLHPGPEGDQVWAESIQPLLDEMMKGA